GEYRQHDQSGHDVRAVRHAVDAHHARADGGTEHHEVQRGGDHRCGDALEESAKGARHLEGVDSPDGVDVHARPLTRLTKMSSSELSAVCRSLNSIPCSLSLRSSAAMPVSAACVSNVYMSSVPFFTSSSGRPERAGGIAAKGC